MQKQKDETIPLRHALDAAKKAVSFLDDRTRTDLEMDEMLGFAVVRLLEIIGEAAKLVSPDLREKHPEIPWSAMVGMRNRLIHGYFDVNYDVVWDTVKSDLPPMIDNLERLLAAMISESDRDLVP
ncbi:MAG: DUF86 domain-containing protein [Methanofollis sp.]|uniref:HepT-like ribonuclease domain-containing protein n=1 Tax=Methanofollis sp. TaxID=2052835 RepID=UPI002621A2DB|nr:DUF86 domain-containing protein [Methanofollis sp.]MDD4254234.1 DUF86 domain-containing protein [Methanofollis sp.]